MKGERTSGGGRCRPVTRTAPKLPDPAIRRLNLIDLACLALIVALLCVVAAGVHGVVRLLLTLAFACYVPGWALTSNIVGLRSTSLGALPVLMSLAITTLAATLSLWIGRWAPITLFIIEAVISGAFIVMANLRRATEGHAVTTSRSAT